MGFGYFSSNYITDEADPYPLFLLEEPIYFDPSCDDYMLNFSADEELEIRIGKLEARMAELEIKTATERKK